MHETLFIADLHLAENTPQIRDLFLRFASERASRAERLYIIGDLFEAWLGDDDTSAIGETVRQTLRGLSDQGVEILLQHGNRDFLLGKDFCAACGGTLLPEETIVTLYGTDALVMHGDQLCTRDEAYQAFRAQVRNAEWQRVFLAKPLEQRRFIAQGAREESREHVNSLKDAFLNVEQEEIEDRINEHGVSVVIHGHTHQSGQHEFVLSGFPVRRYVVGDWRPEGVQFLSWTPTGGRLEIFS